MQREKVEIKNNDGKREKQKDFQAYTKDDTVSIGKVS